MSITSVVSPPLRKRNTSPITNAAAAVPTNGAPTDRVANRTIPQSSMPIDDRCLYALAVGTSLELPSMPPHLLRAVVVAGNV